MMDASTSALIAAVATGLLSLTGVVLNSAQNRSKDRAALPDQANARLGETLDRVNKQYIQALDRVDALEKTVDEMRKQQREADLKLDRLESENQSLRAQLEDARMNGHD